MSDFFGKLKSGAEKVAFEADKMNRLNRAKGELEKTKNQIQAQYLKLGEMYYTQRGAMGVTGPAYDELCQAIMDLEQQVQSKNDDIKRINAEEYSPQGVRPTSQPTPEPLPSPITPGQPPSMSTPAPVAAATKFCSNCGTELPAEIKFCTHCGTKV